MKHKPLPEKQAPTVGAPTPDNESTTPGTATMADYRPARLADQALRNTMHTHPYKNTLPLQRKVQPDATLHNHPVVQRIEAPDSKDETRKFFTALKEDPTDKLILYTHVLSDGLGDAGLIGKLHERITSDMDAYGLNDITTYLAVEKKIPQNAQHNDTSHKKDFQKPSNKKPNGEKKKQQVEPIAAADIRNFSHDNPFFDGEENERYQKLVCELSHAEKENIVWAAVDDPQSTQQKNEARRKGREASNVPTNDHWEIQYPVPVSGNVNHKILKIKEMGNTMSWDNDPVMKTGELHNGMGYGIPDLKGEANEEETKLIEKSGLTLANAWVVSIKPMGAGVNPIRNAIAGVYKYTAQDTLVFIPGCNENDLEKNLPDGATHKSIDHNDDHTLDLSLIQFTEGTHKLFIISSRNFRNAFIQHILTQINDGLIFSGGEGLYGESLATEGDRAVPVFTPRYGFQWNEMAKAMIEHHKDALESSTINVKAIIDNKTVTVYADQQVFEEYGIVRTTLAESPHFNPLKDVFNDHILAYNKSQKKLTGISRSKTKQLNFDEEKMAPEPEPSAKQYNFVLTVQYSQALSALCLPLSFNSNYITDHPGDELPNKFNFKLAIDTFLAERKRLQTHANWFNHISEIANDASIVAGSKVANPPPAPAPEHPAPAPTPTHCSCYITTACMLIHGLPDDCEELTVLRQLRDDYILSLPHGKKLIKLYYDYAPAIVCAIDQREDRYEIYQKLYRVIRLCVDLTLKQNYEAAFAIYCYMVHYLKEIYLPEVPVDFAREFGTQKDVAQ